VFYFAWVADGNTTFGAEHHVVDEDIFSFEIQQQEGDFASLTLEIRNPRTGLLNSGREQWAWLSYRKGIGPFVPLFHGRVVGTPASIEKDIVSIEFTARPPDFLDQKKVLAETLKVAPYYDPVWIDTEKAADLDTVLEARSQLWHIGRTDKLVTVSDIIVGEDGTLTLGETDVFSLELNYGSAPIQKIHVDANVTWDQKGFGIVDLSQKIIDKFDGGLRISSYTGQGLEASWPKYGTDIGSGWTVNSSKVDLLSGTAVNASYLKVTINPAKATPNVTIEPWWEFSPEGYDYWYDLAYQAAIAQQMLDPIVEARFYLWVFKPLFMVQYSGSRARAEHLSFDVTADTQDLVNDSDPVVVTLSLSSANVASPIDANNGIPIGDVRNNTYFGLDRAKRSINYLMALCRARFLASARAVEVSFDTTFDIGITFSCRKDVILTLPELPGGECRGKIIGYTLSLDGSDGDLKASCKIGCCIGKGNSVSVVTGTPSYVTSGYVADYQFYAGADIDPFAGKITYKDFKVVPKDDGLDFRNMTPENVIGDIKATALYTLTGNPSLNQTVSIGARTYTFKLALTGADQVLIGFDQQNTSQHLADAINAEEGLAGVTYGTGTVVNADVAALSADAILRVTAKVAGPDGNAIVVSDTVPAGSWDHGTLTLGSHGINVYNKPGAQASALSGEFGSVQEAIDALNAKFTEIEVSLKPIDGGPFTTEIPLVVSEFMVPKTIDLEAA
jgi:hypothetical protein